MDRWERIQELFDAALAQAPEARTAYVQDAAEDTTLRVEVLALLAAHEARGRLDSIADRLDAASAVAAARLPPVLSGRYAIEREIGRGGMAMVYLAHDQKHDRQVALKVLRSELALAVRAEQFVREIAIAAKLAHPHILPLHDSGEAEGIVYYVMPYVEGESLRDRLIREPQLSVADALRIAGDVAAALSYAHSRGVVHRDIKPENILLAPGGEALIADFGIARALTVAGGHALSETGAVGTPLYMSPEQAAGSGLDGRSDIYSLGCVLYEMLAGHPPFTGATAQEVIARHACDPIPVLEAARPGVTASVARAVRTALAKQPVDRFATADQFAAAFTPPAAAGHRLGWPASAALALVVLVAGGVLTRQLLVRAPATGPSAQSVAVLPFVNLTGDSANDYLTDGFSEELISTLAQIPGLRVPARTSSFSFKGKVVPVRQIGESLGVASVLEGSVRQVGTRLRITAQLIKVADASHLWSETYDRELGGEDVLKVQEEIARAIVGPLQVKLAIPAAPRPENPEAYQLYLKGRFFWNRGTKEGLTQALTFFNAAIAKDSGYARAYAGLADVYLVLWANRYLPRAAAHPQARAAAERAIVLDSLLAEAYASRGRLRTLEWDWSGAEQDLHRAVALNPGAALGHRWYAQFLTRRGRAPEAIREARRAVELDPLSALVQETSADAYLFARQYERAVEEYRKSLELEPSRAETHQRLGVAYLQQNKFADALREFQATLDLLGGRGWTSYTVAEVGYAYARMGRRQDALRILADLKARLARDKGVTRPIDLAILYAGLGEHDRAFAWLAKAYEDQDNVLNMLRVHPLFDPLRSDPRFNDLMKKVGL